MDRAVISKIYDDPILHILAHRGEDEEAMSYVENFVQYRHSGSPLMIDLSDFENTLRIIVHEGKGLPPLDDGGKWDCFVVAKVQPFKLKERTRVVRQSMTPKWDHPLDFRVTAKHHQHIMVELECWDWDQVGGHELIGKHVERLEFGQSNVAEKWITLFDGSPSRRAQGQILLSIECDNLWKQ